MVKLKSTAKKPAAPAGPVEYPEIKVVLHRGEDALTAEDAKRLLGWTEETEEVKFGAEYLLIDEDDKKVRCANNTRNRPLRESGARQYAQDILKGRWRLNGETIVVGKSGQVLSGQHRLVGIVLAEQIRTGPQAMHWEDYWKTPVRMDCIVVYGVSEDSETVRTLDNVIPRTLSDVLFSDGSLFGKAKPGERKALCRMVEYAIKFLWSRAGADEDAFSPKRTHSESMDFLERHGRVIRAVKHIHEENQPGLDDDGKPLPPPIGRYVSPGYASGLLYLMGCSKSDGDKYRNADTPSEKRLNWDMWERACEFWVLLAKGGKEMLEVHYAFASLCDPDSGVGKGTLSEQLAILAKAWAVFAQGKKITKADVSLNYKTDDEGMRHLNDTAWFGGIDAMEDEPEAKGDDETVVDEPEEEGEATDAEPAEEGETAGPESDDPTPDEIEKAKEQAKLDRVAAGEEAKRKIQARKDAKAREKAMNGNAYPTPEDIAAEEADDRIGGNGQYTDVPEEGEPAPRHPRPIQRK